MCRCCYSFSIFLFFLSSFSLFFSLAYDKPAWLSDVKDGIQTIEIQKTAMYVITATGGAGGNGHSFYTGSNAGNAPVRILRHTTSHSENLFNRSYFSPFLQCRCNRSTTKRCSPEPLRAASRVLLWGEVEGRKKLIFFFELYSSYSASIPPPPSWSTSVLLTPSAPLTPPLPPPPWSTIIASRPRCSAAETVQL